MKKEDFKDISNPVFMETSEIILKNLNCEGIKCEKCGINKQNRADNNYFCMNSSLVERIMLINEFKELVNEEQLKQTKKITKENNEKLNVEQAEELKEQAEHFELKSGMKYVLENGIVRKLRAIEGDIYWSTDSTNCKSTFINWFETRKLNKIKDEQKQVPKQELYVIWNPSNNNPMHKHTTIYEAEKEAERLATYNPNQEFLILKAVKKVKGTVKIESETL